MREFRECLINSDLADLNFRGSTFTWWNKRTSNPIAKKIDRILINDAWLQKFPLGYGYFGEPEFSDHSPAAIILDHSGQKRKKPFKFYNFLLQNPDFFQLIQENWISINALGSEMSRVSAKLKAIKKLIRDFSKKNYSNLELRTAEAHEVLLKSQRNVLANPTDYLATLEREAHRKWLILEKAEESFFHQRSNITWLREGDKNTRYFHRMTDSRQASNHIHFLVDDFGNKIESQDGIQKLCVDYFAGLLGNQEGPPLFQQDDINSILNVKCTADQKSFLGLAFLKEEIKEAFFSLPRNKSSGPDGYSAEFFRACWSVVGAECTYAVAEFFSSGKLLKQWNATFIVLIPKTSNAQKTSEFRPIALLNTVYKVISKLLGGRLKSILNSVISPTQSAFLLGRLLLENVLLATQLVQGYDRKNNETKGMLKVDLRKAFDSVRWDFILSILKALEIPSIFINWIKECITSATFFVLVNGMSSDFFKSRKGMRQGDPISPYLFVLAMEVFSKQMTSRYQSGLIGYHPKTERLQISHLMFADDVMVFFDGRCNSLHSITETLDDYASWSGLQINSQKSKLFHAGLSQMESLSISRFGLPIGSLPIRYLGLPLMSRKLKVSEYAPLLDKIVRRFKSWAVKSLSFAGRLLLIKSVISGSIILWMSSFILPKTCIKKIESLCARYLWSGNIEQKSNGKVAWSKVCLPKQEGGLGLRSFLDWNTTLCLRYIWLLFSNSGSLWVAWHKQHNIKNNCFWELKERNGDSWTWKKILKLRLLSKRFLNCDVGNGTSAWFWHDRWTPFGTLIDFIGEGGPQLLRIPLSAKVSDACSREGWCLPPPRSDNILSLHAHLTTIKKPSSSLLQDSYSWCINNVKYKDFSSSKTWSIIRPRAEEIDWFDCIWFKGSIPKHSFIMWLAQLSKLATTDRLIAWGMDVASVCGLCNLQDESRNHLFLECSYTLHIWKKCLRNLGTALMPFRTWPKLFRWMKTHSIRAPSLLRKLLTQTIIYVVWKQRNNVLHNAQVIPSSTMLRQVDRLIRNTISSRYQTRRFSKLMKIWLSH